MAVALLVDSSSSQPCVSFHSGVPAAGTAAEEGWEGFLQASGAQQGQGTSLSFLFTGISWPVPGGGVRAGPTAPGKGVWGCGIPLLRLPRCQPLSRASSQAFPVPWAGAAGTGALPKPSAAGKEVPLAEPLPDVHSCVRTTAPSQRVPGRAGSRDRIQGMRHSARPRCHLVTCDRAVGTELPPARGPCQGTTSPVPPRSHPDEFQVLQVGLPVFPLAEAPPA